MKLDFVIRMNLASPIAIYPLQNSDTNSSKRILMLITSLVRSGGAESQVVRLSMKLKSRGWDVMVVSLVKPSAYVEDLEAHNIKSHSLDMYPGVPDPRALVRLRSIINGFHPDVVHCHMFHANLLGRFTRLSCQIPVLICTAHSVRENSRRGGPSWHRELLYRFTDAISDRTTIICHAAYERYLRVGAASRKRLMVIPNGVDTDIFSRSTERRAKLRRQFGVEKDFVWLAVGRLVVQKDYPTLFKALEMLPHDHFVVLIAGDGPLEKSLRKECNARHLAGKVRFCGLRKDVIDLYDAADGFVMSSNSEGLPMAALEAAAMGLPAVVTHVGGTADIVIDRVTGYVVPPGDAQQLASGLQRVMHASPESRGIMGRAARQHCQNNYGMDAIVQKWLDLYAECFSPARVLTATRTYWNSF